MIFVNDMLEDKAILESLNQNNITLRDLRDVNGSRLLEFNMFDMAVDSYIRAHIQQPDVKETLVIAAEIGSRLSRQSLFSGKLAALKSEDRKSEVSWFGKVSCPPKI